MDIGFYLIELLKKEDKRELKKCFMPRDYKLPRVQRDQIISEPSFEEAYQKFRETEKMMQEIPVAKR
jgi:hypothetical protein